MESNHLMPPYQDGATRRALPEWIPAGDLNSPVSITEAADRHLSLPGMDLAVGVEPTQRRYECRMRPSTSRQKNKTWSPALKSNQLIRFTRPAHRRQCLQGMAMLGHTYLWCGVRDSNPCPKIGNLRSWPLDEPSTKMEREERIELSWPAWKAGTQPMSHSRVCIYLIVKELDC